jgi:hypothetical protein
MSDCLFFDATLFGILVGIPRLVAAEMAGNNFTFCDVLAEFLWGGRNKIQRRGIEIAGRLSTNVFSLSIDGLYRHRFSEDVRFNFRILSL